MNVVPAIVWIAHDPGARNVTGNRASADLLNLPPNANHSRYAPEVAGRFRFYDQNGRELTPETLPLHRAAATGQSVRDFQETIVSSDGVERHVYGNVTPLLDEAGHPAGAVGAFIDITERVHAEKALRQGEARLRRLVESNIIGIIFSQGGGNVTMANDALLEIIGYTRTEFEAGQIDWMKITPPEYRQRDAEAMAEANQRGACTPYEKEFIRKDGSHAPILIGFTYNKEDQAPYVGFILDLTPQKQAEEDVRRYAARLEQSNRELQDFAFVASHDLQEPLRKIQAFGERLNARIEGQMDDNTRDYLERMLSAATRMRAMINDLLALSRVTTQGRPFQQVDLNEVAREVLSDLETRIERTGGRVEVDSLPTIEADPLQMHQLLQNLAGNGLKFHRSDAPPVVRLYAEGPKESRQVIIYVEDNGIGFEEQYLDRIFQPFQRLHGMSQYEGSGMGLAICRKIVERHAGKITARSTPGEGATFMITLPVHQPRRSDSQ